MFPLLLVVAVPDEICRVVFENAQNKPETEVEAVARISGCVFRAAPTD